jgi:hypothetical protein
LDAFIRKLRQGVISLGLLSLLLLGLHLPAWGRPPTLHAPVKETPKVNAQDSAVAPMPKPKPDSLPARVSSLPPSAMASNQDSVRATPDSVHVVKTRADTVVLIQHRFNHKEQIIAGGVVMACLAAMMAVMNNYNPR